jgi:AraC-like DNA-binding protein
VAEQIRAGEERVLHIGVEGEAPAATIALERRDVTREVERLKADENYMYKMADANPDLIQYMERNAGRQLSEDEMYTMLAKEVSRNKAEGELVEFARYLENPTGKLPSTTEELTEITRPTNLRKAGDKIREWTSQGRDEAFLRQEYRNFKAVQTATDLNLDKVAREAGVTSSELTRQVRKYFRVRGQFKIIDNRSGTALEPLADSFVQADNLKNKAINQAISEARPVLDASTKTGLRELAVTDLEALERTGDLGKLSEEQRPVMQALSQLFEKSRKNLAKLGVNIQEISAEKAQIYIPRMQVDASTTTGRLRDRIRQVEDASGISFKSHFQAEDVEKMREKGGTAFSELLQAHEFMTGEKAKTAAQLSKFVAEARTVDGTARLMAVKSSRKALSLAKARAEVGIPSFLRETDLNKLYIRWNADALKQAYWRNSLQELTKQRGLLAAGGDRAGVEYVDWYLKKLSGGEQGLARWATQTKNELSAVLTSKLQAAERAGDKKSAFVLSAMQGGLDLPSILTGTMYGNIFALNPKAAVQNLIQPLVTTIPELSLGGNGWAIAKGLKGYFETLKALRNPGELSKMLEERGYVAPHFSDEMSGAFRTGVEKSAVSRLSRAALDKLTSYGMVLMQTSETINRVATMKMADGIAEDLMRGSQSAKYFLNGVGRGYQHEFNKLVQAGDLPALQKKMGDYLIAKTMFHYSP